RALSYLARLLRAQPTNRVAAERLVSALSQRNFCLPVQPLRHTGLVNGGQFSPDGQRVVTSSLDGYARLWDSRSGQLMGELKHDAPVHSAGFSPDGGFVVTASKDGTARIWDGYQ